MEADERHHLQWAASGNQAWNIPQQMEIENGKSST